MVQQKMDSDLNYFFAEKNNCLVISLVGSLSVDQQSILEECAKEMEASSAKWIIINFRDVSCHAHKQTLECLRQLQNRVRMKPATLKLSSIHPELKKMLLALEIVRAEELTNNLMEALTATLSIEEEAA
jgi:anti-anti-sigma regulatory factor